MTAETERHWCSAKQNFQEAERSGSADDRSWRSYAAVEEALAALISEPPGRGGEPMASASGAPCVSPANFCLFTTGGPRYTRRNRLSNLVSLLPIDVPQDGRHDLRILSYLEGRPTHTADAGINYQEDSSLATEHLGAARRVMQWVQEQLEEKTKAHNV